MDKNFQPVVCIGDPGIESGVVSRVYADGSNQLRDLEKGLQQTGLMSHGSAKRLVGLVSDNSIFLGDHKSLGDLICREVDNDLRNPFLRETLGLVTVDRQKISPPDVYKILRLFHINHGLAYSCEFKTTTVITDAALGDIWQAKLSPLLQRHSLHSAEVFRSVLETKKIPNPSQLYFDSLISMVDILDLREDVQGRRFREWLSSTDYDPDTIKRALEAKKPWSKSWIIKALRWVAPKLMGTVNPLAGIIASCCDSYVLDRFLNGWHPNFFLDDKLKADLDAAIRNHDRAIRSSRQPPW